MHMGSFDEVALTVKQMFRFESCLKGKHEA
jgi:hypothetical protein